MKKYIVLLVLSVMTALSVSACGGKKTSETEAAGPGDVEFVMPETTPEETNPENGLPLSKQPDPDAPVLASIVVYAPNESGKISGIMDAAEELSGESIVELLISHGTLAEGVSFVSMEESDSDETVAAGPGADASASVKNGTVTLSGFAAGSGLSEDEAKQAVIDTFRENYEFGSVELVLQ